MTSEEIIQQSIVELENCYKKQRTQLEQLKDSVLKKEQIVDLSPYIGSGYYYNSESMTFDPVGAIQTISGVSGEYYDIYPTKQQAEWQAKSDRARRKLYHLMTRLNPKGWKPNKQWYSIPIKIGEIDSFTIGQFHSAENRNVAEKELQDELQYFNWFNSPQAKGE